MRERSKTSDKIFITLLTEVKLCGSFVTRVCALIADTLNKLITLSRGSFVFQAHDCTLRAFFFSIKSRASDFFELLPFAKPHVYLLRALAGFVRAVDAKISVICRKLRNCRLTLFIPQWRIFLTSRGCIVNFDTRLAVG